MCWPSSTIWPSPFGLSTIFLLLLAINSILFPALPSPASFLPTSDFAIALTGYQIGLVCAHRFGYIS